MQKFLLAAHSGWRWIVFFALVGALIYGVMGLLGKARWSGFGRKLAIFAPIAVDIQFLLGLVLYGMGKYWTSPDAGAKYYHPLLMIAALALGHVFIAKVKRASDNPSRFKLLVTGMGLVLILIVAGILLLAGGSARLFKMG